MCIHFCICRGWDAPNSCCASTRVVFLEANGEFHWRHLSSRGRTGFLTLKRSSTYHCFQPPGGGGRGASLSTFKNQLVAFENQSIAFYPSGRGWTRLTASYDLIRHRGIFQQHHHPQGHPQVGNAEQPTGNGERLHGGLTHMRSSWGLRSRWAD